MNVKAERIERLLQVCNRAFLSIISGQRGDVLGESGIEFRKLQKVDAGVFGSDRFAFEMVHFLKSSRKNAKGPRGEGAAGEMAQLWEALFLDGLETLLVECAVVADDIERDCFVSRVYCWFSEKLQERRDFPKNSGALGENIPVLKTAVQGMDIPQAKHTLAGLEMLASGPGTRPGTAQAASSSSALGQQQDYLKDPNDYDIPPIDMPAAAPVYKSFSQRNNRLPVYVRHHLPSVLDRGRKEDSEYAVLLPKIPDSDTQGGPHPHPANDAERTMHELWLARRRQEAFDWKTQQHMSLVMDRLELHKSRLESDALRRQETNSYLKQPSGGTAVRPFSASDIGSRFAPHLRAHSPKRPHGDYPNSKSLSVLLSISRPGSPDATDEQQQQQQQQEGGEESAGPASESKDEEHAWPPLPELASLLLLSPQLAWLLLSSPLPVLA